MNHPTDDLFDLRSRRLNAPGFVASVLLPPPSTTAATRRALHFANLGVRVAQGAWGHA
jgi:hypothetical protein